jgi:hypothetical protein
MFEVLQQVLWEYQRKGSGVPEVQVCASHERSRRVMCAIGHTPNGCLSHGTGQDEKYKTEYSYYRSIVPGTTIGRDQVDENYFCTESMVKSFLTQIKDVWNSSETVIIENKEWY